METLHLTGHFQKWNLDAHYQNSIGNGFVFCAYSFPDGYFSVAALNNYPTNEVLVRSFLDLQFYGQKYGARLTKGKLKSYDFHPANSSAGDVTSVMLENAVRRGINYQLINLGIDKVIIPNFYENESVDQYIAFIKTINKWLSSNKLAGKEYYMTIVLPNHFIIDYEKIDKLLFVLTDQNIVFDGYYVVCESKPDARQKLSIDFKYFANLANVLTTLNKQKFKTIYSYANWDALVFLAVTDISYITIGTYENLRSFSIKRFTQEEDGGPSKGFYFSEKLLNMVKSPLLELIRLKNALSLIRNEKNIFSDVILEDGFPWSNQKPEVHKNYLLAIDRLLHEIASISNIKDRINFVLDKIVTAKRRYAELESNGVFLNDESANYHLSAWETFLRSY
jgi:hypothetical protein